MRAGGRCADISPMTDPVEVRGAVLWFREDLREGAVQTDDGRFLRFFETRGTPELELGERVSISLSADAAPRGQVRVGALPPPKSFVSIEEVRVQRVEPGQDASEAVTAGRAVRRTAKAAPTRRRDAKAKPARKPGEALDRHTPVLHGHFGQGFVIMSTSRVARVRFGAQERSVRVDELELLDR